MNKVIITGAAGFVGAAVVKSALVREYLFMLLI